MAALEDLVSNLKNGVLNIGQLTQQLASTLGTGLSSWLGTSSPIVTAFTAPGRFAQGSNTSPVATLQSAIGTSALLIVPFRATRRAISFHSCDPTNNTTIWITPLATLSIGQGVPIVPGQDYVIDSYLGCNSGWTAIAGTGSANKLLILEFI